MSGEEEYQIPKYTESHFAWAKEKIKEAKGKYDKAVNETLVELAKRLEKSKRIPLYKICALIGNVMERDGYCSARYVRMVFGDKEHPELRKYMEVSKTTKKNKERKAQKDAEPPSSSAPEQKEVIAVEAGGRQESQNPEAPTPAKKDESQPSFAKPSGGGGEEVEKLKKIIESRNKELAEAKSTIAVQQQTIEDIHKERMSRGSSGSGKVNVVKEPQAPTLKIDTKEAKLQKEIEELTAKLTPFEKQHTIEIDGEIAQMLATTERLPVDVSVNPKSHKIEITVNKRALKRLLS